MKKRILSLILCAAVSCAVWLAAIPVSRAAVDGTVWDDANKFLSITKPGALEDWLQDGTSPLGDVTHISFVSGVQPTQDDLEALAAAAAAASLNNLVHFTIDGAPGTVRIPDNFLQGHSDLLGVNLTADTLVIGRGAFSGALNLASANLYNVTQIGENAFQGCASLISIFLVNSNYPTINIGAGAFSDCGPINSLGLLNISRVDVAASAFGGSTSPTEIYCLAYNSPYGLPIQIGTHKIPIPAPIERTLREGESLTLTSDLHSAIPGAQVKWFRESNDPISPSLTPVPNNIINQVAKADAGFYWCWIEVSGQSDSIMFPFLALTVDDQGPGTPSSLWLLTTQIFNLPSSDNENKPSPETHAVGVGGGLFAQERPVTLTGVGGAPGLMGTKSGDALLIHVNTAATRIGFRTATLSFNRADIATVVLYIPASYFNNPDAVPRPNVAGYAFTSITTQGEYYVLTYHTV